MAKSNYHVKLRHCPPDFKAERRLIELEKDRAKREIDRLRNGSRLKAAASILMDGYGQARWWRYRHDLERYSDQLERYEKQMKSGLIPLMVDVTNVGPDDHEVKVTVSIPGGRFLVHHTAPIRPQPPEGLKVRKPFRADRVAPVVGGFSRRKVKLTAHRFTAEFSHLESDDGAVVLNQVVYAETKPGSSLVYEITSRGLDAPEVGTLHP